MIRPLVHECLSRGAPLATEQVNAIQRAPLNIEPKYRDPEFVGSNTSRRTHAVASEDQPATTIRSGDGGHTLDELDLQVSPMVLNPTKVTRPVQIADLARFAGCHHRVRGTEVAHPLPTKHDGFVVGRSSWSWCRRISHRSRMHPSSDSRSARSRFAARAGVVGGES